MSQRYEKGGTIIEHTDLGLVGDYFVSQFVVNGVPNYSMIHKTGTVNQRIEEDIHTLKEAGIENIDWADFK